MDNPSSERFRFSISPMRLRIPLIVSAALLFSGSVTDASVQRSEPQSRPANYEEVHARQGLGRVIVSSDGRFLLYEWGHPYLNWVPETKWMAPSAARRLKTVLYKVELTAKTAASQYLFYPDGGATYWLGDLAPDDANVVVYELDHDEKRVRAGAWDFKSNRITWFALVPDEGKIEDRTAWISKDEFLYPAKHGAAELVRASVVTGEAQPCTTCSLSTLEQLRKQRSMTQSRIKATVGKIERKDLPPGARLVGGAENGTVAVYAREDDDVLSLLVKKADGPVLTLFENKRKRSRPRKETVTE